MKRLTRKGQEEIMGFVAIVVVIAVIFLVFLGIFLRRPAEQREQESSDVLRFLESMMEYTSDCAISYVPDYSDMGELISECYEDPGEECLNGENVCDVLNEELGEIIDNSWKYGPDRPIKGYIFNSSYKSEQKTENIVIIEKGNCSLSFVGASYLSPAFPGTIESSLRLCF